MTGGVAGVFGRALAWNALLGFLTGGAASIVLALLVAGDGGGDEGFGPVIAVVGVVVGIVLGVAAGVVHGLAQVPVVLLRPRRPRRVARVVATTVSVLLVTGLLASGGPTPWQAVAVFVPYVLLTPFLSVWGYAASGTPPVTGAPADGSLATSE